MFRDGLFYQFSSPLVPLGRGWRPRSRVCALWLAVPGPRPPEGAPPVHSHVSAGRLGRPAGNLTLSNAEPVPPERVGVNRLEETPSRGLEARGERCDGAGGRAFGTPGRGLDARERCDGAGVLDPRDYVRPHS